MLHVQSWDLAYNLVPGNVSSLFDIFIMQIDQSSIVAGAPVATARQKTLDDDESKLWRFETRY